MFKYSLIKLLFCDGLIVFMAPILYPNLHLSHLHVNFQLLLSRGETYPSLSTWFSVAHVASFGQLLADMLANRGLEKCRHIFISLSLPQDVPGRARYGMGAEPSCPKLSELRPSQFSWLSYPNHLEPAVRCEGASWEQKKFLVKRCLNYWPADSWAKQTLVA